MPNILDTLDVIENLSSIYESDRAFAILKDFERVIDELGIYVYKNWDEGELVAGPEVDRHWVKCTFMWPEKEMPDPMGGKRLLDYDCKISYEKSSIIKPRKIKKPDDIRPGTKKGKLDRKEIWVVKIQMPKKLIVDMYSGQQEMQNFNTEPAVDAGAQAQQEMQPADDAVATAPAPEEAV